MGALRSFIMDEIYDLLGKYAKSDNTRKHKSDLAIFLQEQIKPLKKENETKSFIIKVY